MFNFRKGITYIGDGVDLGDHTGKIKTIKLPDEDRRGHLFCFGATRVGKTRLIESMIEQDIRKGYSVCFIDPKGDIDIFSKIVQVALEENRQDDLCLVTPIFPGCSSRIDPLAYYYMNEEIVSHVVSGIKAKEEFFVNVAYETTLVIVLSLLLFKKIRGDSGEEARINFDDIKNRASHAGLTSLKNELEVIKNIEPGANEIIESLNQILSSPPDYFAKISSSLRTVLTSISTGSVGTIIGRAKSNRFIERLENNQKTIFVVQTGSLLTRRTAHIVGRVLISMVQSFIGRRYASGRKVSPPLCVYIDEMSNVIYLGIEDLFNKAGGADVWVHGFTQSIADLEAEMGPAYAKKILDNTNTKVFMRVNDPSTAKYISDYAGIRDRFSPFLSLSGGITIREVKEYEIKPEEVLNLKPREFYMFSFNARCKGVTSFTEPAYIRVKYPEANIQ